MSSSRIRTLRFVLVTAILLLGVLPAAQFASQFIGGSRSLVDIKSANAVGGLPLLGFDCGLGTTQAGLDVNGQGTIGDGVLDTICTWNGDADGDLTPDPLVSDAAPNFLGPAPALGGGFSVEIRLTGVTSPFNGFDITFSYDTKYLNAVLIDQTGLSPWDTAFSVDKSIDTAGGTVRLAQVLLGGSVATDSTLFRVRFDIVGVGTSPLTITSSVIPTGTGVIDHKRQQASFNSTAASGSLFDIFWDFSPKPEVPGSPLTFTATASCPSCGTLSYDWDTNSDGTADASGSTATITAPTPTLIVNRVELTVSDGTNSAKAVRRLPFTSAVTGPSTLAVDTPGTWTGLWLGGVPPYSGSWRFCPGSGTTANAVCARPAPAIASTPGQTDSQTLSALPGPGAYHFSGIYNDTFTIRDTAIAWIATSGAGTVVLCAQQCLHTIVKPFLVEVTGGTAAYTVTVSNPAKVNTGDTVTFTATMRYATTYPFSPTNFRSSSFAVTFDFGDGLSSTVTVTGCSTAEPPVGTCTATATHVYSVLSSTVFPVKVTAKETAPAGVSKIQESGTSTITVNVAQPLAGGFTFAPASPFVGDTVTFTGTATGGTPPYTFSWDFGDASGTATGPIVTHAYSAKGPFTVTMTLTDSGGSPPVVVTHVVTVSATPLSGDFTFTPATAGKPVTFTASATGGTAPYSFSWAFGDGSSDLGSPVSHTYATKGAYTVVLTIGDLNGASTTVTHSVTVAAQPLAITASCTPSVQVGATVVCIASASGGTAPYVFTWDVGKDGIIDGTGPDFTTSFPTKGTYSIDAIVTDVNAATARVNLPVTVTPLPLTVSFTFTPSSPQATVPVTFTATANGGTQPYNFAWSFGDGSTGTGEITTHTYNAAGTFNVVVTVTDANGGTASAAHTVDVAPAPQLGVSITVGTSTAGKPTTFDAVITGGTGPFTATWDFGDGTTGTGTSTTHTYATKGTFAVTVSVTDSLGAQGSATTSLNVLPQPLVITASCTGTAMVGNNVVCSASASGGTGPYQFTWDVGKDGIIDGTGPDFVTSFATKGTYSIDAIVTDANSASARVNLSVVITPIPLAVSFTFDPAIVTAGKPVTFTATATGGTGPYTFVWLFGDGTSATGNPVTHSYAVKGSQVVTLTVTDMNGATAVATQTITIDPQPLVVSVTVTAVPGTAGKPVTLTASISGGTGPYSVAWDFGDGTTGSGETTSHTYVVKGTYTVTARVTDANGATASATTSVTIAPQPLFISATCDTNVVVGGDVTCSAYVEGGTRPYSVTWDVGKDGTIDGTGINFVTSFPSAGTFSIDAIVTDANLDSARVNLTVVVTTNPPVITASCSPSAMVGETIICTASATGGTPPYTFTWDVGKDGTIDGTGANFTTSFPVKGTYSIDAIVTDASGLVDRMNLSVTITPLPLTIFASVTPLNVTVGQTVTYVANATGGTQPYAFAWDFGDGQTGSGAITTHTYSTKGTFNVVARVTDVNGASATASFTVFVYPLQLTADFTFSPASPTAGQPVTFTATASGGTSPYSFSWSFGDGTTGTGNPVTHSYSTGGNFTVTLTVTDSNGATFSTRQIISVRQGITAVDFAPTHTLVGETSFVAKITGGTSPFSCTWNFGDGTPAQTGCNTTHNYTMPGTYTVNLSVQDSGGSSMSTSGNVLVEQGPTLIRGKVHWTHHLTGGTSATQTFVGKVSNPSSFTVDVTLTVNIFTDTGVFVQQVSLTKSMAPGSTDLNFAVTWTPTMTGKFAFTATLTYKIDFGDLSMPPDGVNEIVVGTDASKSGSFAVVP